MASSPDRSRRRLLGLAALALPGWAPLARAQAILQPRRRVAFAFGATPQALDPWRDWLAQRGLVDGRDVELRHAPLGEPGSPQAQAAARRLVASRPDAIVVPGGEAPGLRRLTRDIPIVFFGATTDPVRAGLVESLERPGGNVTGTAELLRETVPRVLGVLAQMRPAGKRAGVLVTRERRARGGHAAELREARRAAEALLPMAVVEVTVARAAKAPAARQALAKARVEVLFAAEDVAGHPWTPALLDHLREARIPAGFVSAETVRAGGLLAFIRDRDEARQQAAAIVARLLRGEPAAAIPVHLAARYQVAVNLRTARAMRVEIPAPVLLQASEVVD